MSNSELVLQLLILAVSKAESIAALLSKAKAENRDVLDEELAGLSAGADKSLEALQAWIDSKRGA